MPAAIEFDVRNGPEVAELLDRLKGKAKRAVVGAMKDIGKSVRTELARGITKEIKVPYGRTLKAIRIDGPTPSNFAMRISMQEKNRPGLMNFGAKQKPKGVAYRVAKSGKRGFVAGAFIARGRPGRGTSGKIMTGLATGAERVFKRKGKARIPLFDLKGPSLNAVVVKNKVDAIQKKAIETKLPDRILQRLRVADQRSR